ncbi:RNA-directed DNA polymerase [Chryseolinea lacunae]|uniref:RNA-directed DNA polymerase n=1 Tax=Chryseolinea lacunae TaxID=2801331 RepID=A0ABS1KTW4_9BACT|nr:RNA-directed DNA polymerase [Chryseolinea lacunae]MBL0742633.1 RNA-directed DNA polymerase [Chryseolinea lacunae]
MAILNISLEDLIIAYRKAKVDAFYESGHNTAISFALYETELLENLRKLRSNLNSGEHDWVQHEDFVGSHAILLKSVSREGKEKSVVYSNANKRWFPGDKAIVDFRIIGQHSVDFHILSSLWIDKVGYRLEEKVSENSYGCRLKRSGQTPESFVNEENKNSAPNKLQLGHFRRYIPDYKKWQRNGLKAIKDNLKEEPRLVAATFDLKKFYHRIDPKFLLDDIFITGVLKSTYSEEQKELTTLLVKAIEFWSNHIVLDAGIPREFKVNNIGGVPLGLGASKVFANLILIGIDDEIKDKLKPVYYGRYVDDFFIVLKDKTSAIQTSDDLWTYLSSELDCIGPPPEGKLLENVNYACQLNFSSKSKLEFGRDKEKIFILEGSSGEVLIDKIRKDLDDNSSEWKMLPDAEENLDDLTHSIVTSTSDDSEDTPSLRNADNVSIQRLKFSLRLRDYEAMIGLAPEAVWSAGIENFFRLSFEFVLSAEHIPIYYKYYPRVIKLAIKADKQHWFIRLWDKYQESWVFLARKVDSENERQLIDKARVYANKLIMEATLSSLPIDDQKTAKNWIDTLKEIGFSDEIDVKLPEKLFYADLHSLPFRTVFLNEERKIPSGWGQDAFSLQKIGKEIDSSLLSINVRKTFVEEVFKIKGEKATNEAFVPNGLFFFTRPHSLLEITYLIPEWYTDSRIHLFNSIASTFGLPHAPSRLVEHKTYSEVNKLIELQIPTLPNVPVNPSFALTSLETKKISWDAVVTDAGVEPDTSRYSRIFQLVNEIIKRKERIDYVVFSELSIPRNILLYLASKLKTRKTSLIAGVEYEKKYSKKATKPDIVSNQLFYIVNTLASGRYEQLAIVQEKTSPAIHEKKDLRELGKKKLMAGSDAKFLINHGGFYFSGLICNDFLNINYRNALRGYIDALIVVEWNQDTETYDALVQSSSSDLHCFVMQVNNRTYGDTRSRAPYKESYMRDQVRIRGGEFDYFVLLTLKVDDLRKFQRINPSPKKPFKPIPTGYKIFKGRK